ncbi:MAG: hypothetical protein Ct9H300mP18_09960 [Candidatus Neomarinimicrobiota bacterium]|nr:MAG: hypothetical protein Ct9H300mP18_09960 [Candidatus Neomarinimicrobiota bacterium]
MDPNGNGLTTRLVNEIILEEESDKDMYGEFVSHFEMYCHAMNQRGQTQKVLINFY